MRTIEPRKPFFFKINKEHVLNAKRHDKRHCVVGLALRDGTTNPKCRDFLDVEVGARLTIIRAIGLNIRMETSNVLREGLKNFDNTGAWDLQEGVYRLDPLDRIRRRKYERERSKRRSAAGDPHKRTKYLPSGRCKRVPLEARQVNLITEVNEIQKRFI